VPHLANLPHIALAQEWLDQLESWISAHGLLGYDRFDVKDTPCLRSVQHRPWLRRTTSLITDVFPHLSRRLLRVQPTENPKAYALTALGAMRQYQFYGDASFLDLARKRLQWLLQHPTPTPTGLAWSYPFSVHGSGVSMPRGTPIAVVTAIVGEAFALAAECLPDETEYVQGVERIARYFRESLPRIPATGGTYCFAYAPTDQRCIHNANLLVVEHLFRTAKLTGDAAWVEVAEPALAFTLSHQAENGSWAYGTAGSASEAETRLLEDVDHHHSGFVLRSLAGILRVREEPAIRSALERGWTFYKTLISNTGMPLCARRRYPVDIHACAEAILCPAVLNSFFPEAEKYAYLALRWAYAYMRRPRDGAPYYRKYPLYTSKIVFPRWGVAWMYRSLAEYLYHLYADEYAVCAKQGNSVQDGAA